MFKYFLVSSQVHQEKNSCSEAAWIISEVTGSSIELFKASTLPVGGLGLLTFEKEVIIPENLEELIENILISEKIFFCYKIIPLEYFDKFSEEFIYSWINEKKDNILPTETWKININKRHNKINTKVLIDNIAKNIPNQVDLKNPEKIVQIEIVGKYVGLGVLRSQEIIQLSAKIEKEIETLPDDGFMDEIGE